MISQYYSKNLPVWEDRIFRNLLPQREGGCVADLPDVIDGVEKRKYLFGLACRHILNSKNR